MVEINASKGIRLTPTRAPTAVAGTIYFDSGTSSLKVCNDGSNFGDTGETTPIGCVMAWLKSYTNTPALSNKWVECNGQTLSDAESPFNGQVIPNLNSPSRFLRGSTTSGTTGGADTHTLTEAEMPSHTHSITGEAGGGSRSLPGSSSTSTARTFGTNATGGNGAHNNLPSYYEVVWILKVK